MDGLIIATGADGSCIKMTNVDLYFVDCYGNESNLNDTKFTYKLNSPSYDELYNHWLKTKHNLKGDNIMKDKFTMELVWHNCAACPPVEDFHPNLCVTNGSAVFNVSYDDGEWYDPEFNEYIPQDMLHEFWWADVVQTISGISDFKAGDRP